MSYLIAFISGFFVLQWLYRRVKRWQLWRKLVDWWTRKKQKSIVEFYERMEKVLAKHGFERQSHQTPLEFAFALKMPEAVLITEKYNRVRFGEKNLSETEAAEIENWLESLEKKEVFDFSSPLSSVSFFSEENIFLKKFIYCNNLFFFRW